MIDGGEPSEFKSLFKNWRDKDATTKLTFSRRISMTTVQTKFDAQVLHQNPQMASESGMVDDGQSAKEMKRFDNFYFVQVSEEDYLGDDKKKKNKTLRSVGPSSLLRSPLEYVLNTVKMGVKWTIGWISVM